MAQRYSVIVISLQKFLCGGNDALDGFGNFLVSINRLIHHEFHSWQNVAEVTTSHSKYTRWNTTSLYINAF